MKTNFDINIPSIPSRMIKFKIQDIKSTAFGSQRNRFCENKSFLTKKFIESFNNFQQRTEKSDENPTEAESQLSYHPEKSEQEYRLLIPEEKKYMLHNYDKYKNYEVPILKETKYNRGYSFYRTDVTLPKGRDSRKQDQSQSIQNNTTTDNFYFPSKREGKKLGEDKKQEEEVGRSFSKPSCIFKNQTRKKVYSKLQKIANSIPGPGAYIFPSPPKPVKQAHKIEELPENQFDYKKLKEIITNVVLSNETHLSQDPALEKQEVRNNFMFISDDRDRFGQQKYPIANHTSVPGPGAYEIKDTIENKVQKIIVVQEQRKLLKQWFNN